MSKGGRVEIDVDHADPMGTGRNVAAQMVLPLLDQISDGMPREDALKLFSGFVGAFTGHMTASFGAGVVEAVLLGVIRAAHAVEAEHEHGGAPAPGVH